MNDHLILIRHSLPEIKEDMPAREWRLSEEGRERAHRLAEKIRIYPFEVLVSSVETKALETAEIIATKCGMSLQIVEGLHEHERSQVPFLSRPEFEAAVQDFFDQPDVLVFGDETADAAYQRFSSAVFSVLTGWNGKSSVIVSHGTVISLFVSRLTGEPSNYIWKELGLPGFVVLDLKLKSLIAIENIL